MTTDTDALARAIDYLGAVEVAPGRYAFPLEVGKGPWRTCTPATLIESYELHFEHAAYTRAKQVYETRTVPMPSWWSPTCREVWQTVRDADGFIYSSNPTESEGRQVLEGVCGAPVTLRHVTADLNTGEEVSC
jgi:hypothetical protein